jgi:hypothetical protein
MGNFFPVKFTNIGAGTVTISPSSSATFTIATGSSVGSSTGATSLPLNQWQSAVCNADNTNWYCDAVTGNAGTLQGFSVSSANPVPGNCLVYGTSWAPGSCAAGAVGINGTPTQYQTGVWASGSQMGSVGPGTTGYPLVSGGASTYPAYAQLTSAGLNITATPCTNQAITAIAANGTGTCTTIGNAYLANAAITIAGTSVSLGSSTSSFPSPGAIGGTTPAAGTFTTLIATGIVDGEAPITITTSAACNLGASSGCNATAYDSGYTFNQEATAGTAVTYTLPTAAAGKQYCIKNSYNGSAADTGVLRFSTSAAGQSIIYNGTQGASNGYFISGGAAGDAACVVGISSTVWEAYVQVGTWTVH